MGLHLGYRRGPRGGTWYGRRFADSRYLETTFGPADDLTDPDGAKVIGYRDALKAARAWWQQEERKALGHSPDAGPHTVAAACADYLAHYSAKGGKDEYGTRLPIDAHIIPKLGNLDIAKLTTRQIRNWHHGLASAPKRVRTKRAATEHAFREVDGTDADAVRSRRATANRILTVLKAALNHAW